MALRVTNSNLFKDLDISIVSMWYDPELLLDLLLHEKMERKIIKLKGRALFMNF